MVPIEDAVHEILTDVYLPDGIDIWLRSRNSNLDLQRPVDLLATEGAWRVLEEAQRLVDGNA